MSDSRKLTDLSRQELYDLIWASPAIKVAADFGVTETVVKNHCNNRKVPRPTRRYWTKLAAGIKPRKKPLPPTPQEVFEIEAQRRVPKALALPEPCCMNATACSRPCHSKMIYLAGFMTPAACYRGGKARPKKSVKCPRILKQNWL
jgi:hypothetical protein